MDEPLVPSTEHSGRSSSRDGEFTEARNSAIYVTHDREQALALSDRTAVFDHIHSVDVNPLLVTSDAAWVVDSLIAKT